MLRRASGDPHHRVARSEPDGHTLFIGGEFDEARPSTLKDYARRVPDGRYRMIAGSGHWVENDRPAEHQQALRDWLKGRA